MTDIQTVNLQNIKKRPLSGENEPLFGELVLIYIKNYKYSFSISIFHTLSGIEMLISRTVIIVDLK
jgi:hypothetical protein